MIIDFKNVNHRKDYLSVDMKTAISSEGSIFEVGEEVHHEGAEGGSVIQYFVLDSKTMDVKAQTDKGWARISFLYKKN